MAPTTMKAIKCISPGEATLQTVPLPKLRPDYILIKTTAVALNPTDWKHIDFLSTANATVGCDYAGTVVEVGSAVKKSFKAGDRIAGFVHGVNALHTEDGAFAEYIVAKGDLQIRIPDNVSDYDAATLGVGITTVGQGLYQSLGLPLPTKPTSSTPTEQTSDRPWLLVYGGSTATGALAIQFAAKLNKYRVITTCSPHNADACLALGATKAFDYRDPDVGSQIRLETNNELALAFDCISEGESQRICGEALTDKNDAAQKPTVSFLLQTTCPRPDVVSKSTLAYTAVGEAMYFRGHDMPAKPEDAEFGEKFWDLCARLLAAGAIKVHKPEVREGGLEGVFAGLEDLRQGRVSGVKLVYRVGEGA